MYSIILEISWMLIGLAGLIIASYFIVHFAKNLARAFGISELIIGLTIAAIGTSLPEIFTNIQVGLNNLGGIESSGIGIGNVIGSSLANITLILGIGGFFGTLRTTRKSLYRDGIMVIFSVLILFLASSDGIISKIEGYTLIAIYIVYIIFLINTEKIIKTSTGPKGAILYDILFITASFFGLAYFANIMVDNGVLLAKSYAIPQSIIGIFVGLGTSLPELAISITAIIKKSGSLSIGNILGSNIIDPLVAPGIGAIISPLLITATVINFDFLLWIIATGIAILLLFNHLNLNRKESMILILVYLLFIIMKLRFFSY